MPNAYTFAILEIADFIKKHMTGGTWIDPFAGKNSPAQVTNDLNKTMPTKYHMDALEFLKLQPTNYYDGGIIDGPYSPRQVMECYQSIGMAVVAEQTTSGYFADINDEMERIIKPGGKCISFDWNGNGLGKGRHFEWIEGLMVVHGGRHTATLCTVERKINNSLF